jgi:hypothetical protein
MNFVFAGETAQCDNVRLPENVQLCEQFVQLKLINEYLQNQDENAQEQLGIREPTTVGQGETEATLDDFFVGDVATPTNT